MEFDNKIADLEKAIKARRKDLKELESMYCDAQLARDNAKVINNTLSTFHKVPEMLIFFFLHIDRVVTSRAEYGRVP